jgi:hypothetical protein
MSARQPARRLACALSLLASLAMLATALVAPAQTVARTPMPSSSHKSSCSTSSGHAKARRAAGDCARSSHKGRGDTHRATGRHAKHATKRHPKAGAPVSSAAPPASCEDSSAPVRASDGSFSCKDGSQPECENGEAPTASRGGKSLVCPVSSEEEAGAGEAECEEDPGSICAAEASLGGDERACQASLGDPSSFVCEDEA